MKNIGRNINVSDEILVLNLQTTVDNTAIEILPANPDRLYVAISILEEDAFIRLMPSNVDSSTRKGILIEEGSTYELPTDNIYTGPISVINAKDGKHPEIYVTEM